MIHDGKKTTISFDDVEKLRRMAGKFVCEDFKPIDSIECVGLRELMALSFEMGKKCPVLSTEEFLKLMPSATIVENVISDEAEHAKDSIKVLFRQSIEQGGLACTLDFWKDEVKSKTFMAMTANLHLIRRNGIEQKRFVFHMEQIENKFQLNEVHERKIIEVFEKFGVSAREMEDYVTFCMDR